MPRHSAADCPADIGDCLGAADQFAIVAEKVSVAAGLWRKYYGYGYFFPSYLDDVCASSAIFRGASDAQTDVSGDVILIKENGTAGRFKGIRVPGGFEPGTSISGDLITGGGAIKGLEHVEVSGVVDTSGTHPKLDACRQAMIDMKQGSETLKSLQPHQTFDPALIVAYYPVLSLFTNEPGTNVFSSSRIVLQSKRYHYPGYSYWAGAQVELTLGPLVDSFVFNVEFGLLFQREVYFFGDSTRSIFNVHGKRPSVKLEPAISDGETISGLPVLAPTGKVKAKANSYVCGLYASRVRLKGVTVSHRLSCFF